MAVKKTKSKLTLKRKVRKPRKKELRSSAELDVLMREVVKDKQRKGMLTKGVKIGKLREYDIHNEYHYGEKIDHMIFGTGVVQVVKAHKVEVAFAEGNRVLAHAMSGSGEAA